MFEVELFTNPSIPIEYVVDEFREKEGTPKKWICFTIIHMTSPQRHKNKERKKWILGSME